MTPTLEQIRDAVAAEYGITPEQLVSYRCDDLHTEARALAAYRMWNATGATSKQIAAVIGRCQMTAYRMISRGRCLTRTLPPYSPRYDKK